MPDNSIANARLISQQIVNPTFKTVEEVITWMGAMQAQDFKMAKWAIGLRMKEGTEAKITEAINSGQILRTHLLRPTWHFVSREDIYLMLQLSGAKIRAAMKGINKKSGLTANVFKKCHSIIEKSLKGENHLSRNELLTKLAKVGISTDSNRASLILLNAESEGIICSGKMKENQPTYSLLEEMIPGKKNFNKEEIFFSLASKYFKSRSPATLQDFLWWSGLSVKDGKTSLELVKNDFCIERINNKDYILPNSFKFSAKSEKNFFLLPAFDEFLISYKDRSELINSDHQSKIFSNNGIFYPLIVKNGKVIGRWKRETKNDKILIHCHFFESANFKNYFLLKEQVKKFGVFLNVKTAIAIIKKQ